MKIAIVSAIVLSAFASAGQAQDWPVSAHDERCIAAETFEGPGETELAISIEIDGSSTIILANSGWSTVADQQYPELAVEVDGNVYSGAGGIGVVVESKRGFMMNMPAAFLDDVAAGTSLRATLGDRLVDQLSLAGSAEAVSRLRRCITPVRRAWGAAEQERQRLEHIPVDPFANR